MKGLKIKRRVPRTNETVKSLRGEQAAEKGVFGEAVKQATLRRKSANSVWKIPKSSNS